MKLDLSDVAKRTLEYIIEKHTVTIALLAVFLKKSEKIARNAFEELKIKGYILRCASKRFGY
jgi:Mn-dependent DtxR family transcriptional regulator